MTILRILGFSFLVMFLAIGTVSGQKKGTDIQLQSKKYKKMIDRTIGFTVPLLSVEELHGSMGDYVILDAREKEEYEVSHLPNAIFVGYDDPELEMIESLDKDKKLLFYCSIGYRSEKIGEKAKELGFTEVYNLYGSIFEWVNKGYELENVADEKTNKVHGYNRIWGRWIQNADYEKVY